MSRRIITLVGSLLVLSLLPSAIAEAPDPRTVERWQGGWRYPQAGWVVAHIEGNPYQRGLQHGHLLAPEIAEYVRALSEFYGYQAPAIAWEQTRRLVNAIILRGFTPEQLEEMKGIADGAAAAGARFGSRAIDLVDIAAINAGNEIDSIDEALQATPTGLENLRTDNHAKKPAIRVRRSPHTSRCSAFAAVGPATRDGKIVFGHITMFDLYPANYYNVWLDVHPTQGYRFVMQTTPGGIHSGMDYSINQAGILLSETTLDQTRISNSGIPLASRIRSAEQYADSIEKAAEFLTGNGNGLSTTEWILADTRRNEIALLTLGTHTSKLYRSSRNEWIGGAKGFYWSDNNTKDLDVRLETIAGVTGRPSTIGTYSPSKRDAVWLRLFDANQGSIDAEFGRKVLTTPELVAAYAVDAKYTTTELASALQSWGSFGPPVGEIRRPTITELRNYTAIKPLISNPWTLLTASPPANQESENAADRPNLLATKGQDRKSTIRGTEPAWHGTLLPASDADIWLSTAFANFERIVAVEHKLRAANAAGGLTDDDQEEVGVELSYYRSLYEHGARAGGDFPLASTHATMRNENWYQVVTGKGVLLLQALRGIAGADRFDALMDEFGRAYAGKPVSTLEFRQFIEKGTGRSLASFFEWWTREQGLPYIAIRKVERAPAGKQWSTTIEFDVSKTGPLLPVHVSVDSEGKSSTEFALIGPEQPRIVLKTNEKPESVTVDEHGLTPKENGSPFTILSFDTELDRTMIVYGTAGESVGNREAARVLQQALRRREHNVEPLMKSDTEVNDADLRTHNVLLIGRPVTNRVAARFSEKLPVKFGPQSFSVDDEVYAHPESAVIAATANPLNPRYALVEIAGLSSLGTLQVMPQFEEDVFTYAPIVILPHGGEEIDLVAPVDELTRTLR